VDIEQPRAPVLLVWPAGHCRAGVCENQSAPRQGAHLVTHVQSMLYLSSRFSSPACELFLTERYRYGTELSGAGLVSAIRPCVVSVSIFNPAVSCGMCDGDRWICVLARKRRILWRGLGGPRVGLSSAFCYACHRVERWGPRAANGRRFFLTDRGGFSRGGAGMVKSWHALGQESG